MGRSYKRTKISKKRKMLDRIFSNLYWEVLKKHGIRKTRRSQSASEIIQTRLERMQSTSPHPSPEESINATSSFLLHVRSNLPSPEEHTEDIHNAGTNEDDIIYISDSDGSLSSSEVSIKTGKNETKQEAPIKGIPATPFVSSTKFNRSIFNGITVSSGHHLSKPKKTRKSKKQNSTAPARFSYESAMNCDKSHPILQVKKAIATNTLKCSKKNRLLKKIQARGIALQFISTDELNDVTFLNYGIQSIKDIGKLTYSRVTSTQNDGTEVNCEVAEELNCSHATSNQNDKTYLNCEVTEKMTSHATSTQNDETDVNCEVTEDFNSLHATSTQNNETDAICKEIASVNVVSELIADSRRANRIDEDDPCSSPSLTIQKDKTNFSGDPGSPISSQSVSKQSACEKSLTLIDKEHLTEEENYDQYSLDDCSDISGDDFPENEENGFNGNTEGGGNRYRGNEVDGNANGCYRNEDSRDYGNNDEDDENSYYGNREEDGQNAYYGNRHEGDENIYYGDEWVHVNNFRMPYGNIYRDLGRPTSCHSTSPPIIEELVPKAMTNHEHNLSYSDQVEWTPTEPMKLPNYTTENSSIPILVQSHSANSSANHLLQQQQHSASNDILSESIVKSIQFFTSPISGKVLLLLKTKLYFHGSLNIRLIAGNASVFGYELHQKQEVTANSFPGHGVLYLCPEPRLQHYVDYNESVEGLSEYLTNSDFQKIKTEFVDSTDAIVELENDHGNKSITMIKKYMEESIIGVTASDKFSQFHQTESVLHCNFSQHAETGLKVNPEWEEVVMSLNSRQIIVGGRAVGKSTLLRYHINKNLTKFQKILLIDFDIERPETFLPKTISATVITKPLLGPGFLKNLVPIKSYLFDDATAFLAPMKYLQCIHKLLKYCRSSNELLKMPWIINTMGYSQRMDFEVTIAIIRAVNPSDLIQIQGHDSMEFEVMLPFKIINNHCFKFFDYEMQDVPCSYALHIINTVLHIDDKLWNNSTTNLQLAIVLAKLATKLPWNTNLTKIKPPVCASLNCLKILVDDDCVAPNLYSCVINGNLCYLCRSMDDKFIECYGIGFVRAVDMAANTVYLLPSVANMELEKVNTLAVCGVALPTFMLLDQHVGTSVNVPVPYLYREENILTTEMGR